MHVQILLLLSTWMQIKIFQFFTIDPEEMETEQWRDRLRQETLAISRNEVPCSEDEESDNELEITEVEENCSTTTRHKCVEICITSLQKMKMSSQ